VWLGAAVAATNSYLKNLMNAALGLPGIAMGANAIDSDEVTLDYKHLSYREDNDLMSVDADYLSLGIPINEQNDLLFSIEYEAMSGASPIYFSPDANNKPIQVTSGASITDERTAGSLRYRRITKNGVFVITPGASSENDYESQSVTLEYQWDDNAKNTSYALATGFANDKVGATNQNLDVDKKGKSLFAGVTQVLDAQSLLQLNLSFAKESGYLSDPYKLTYVNNAILPDNRPDSRLQKSIVIRYIRHADEINGSLHLDYRYYQDDWSIESHTMGIAWNQQLNPSWLIVPSFRYYFQKSAYFYAPYFTETRSDGIYSSDYRLASFGSILVGFKVENGYSNNLKINFNAEYYARRGELKLTGDYSVDPEPLTSYVFTFGLNYTF
jgi:hypothetical protein